MPRTSRVFRPSSLSLVLMAALLFAGLACACASLQSGSCPPPFEQVDVTVPPDGGPLVVEPDPVEIFRCFDRRGRRTVWVDCPAHKPEKVCWVIDGLQEGQSLHIQEKKDKVQNEKGKSGMIELLDQGQVTHPQRVVRSFRPLSSGTWTYELWVTAAGSDEQLHYKDPEAIVRDEW